MMDDGTASLETRPRTVNSGKDLALHAAIDNFQRRGYHGTSMRDIARHAGLTVGSIYNHFPSKQHLLEHIMIRVLSDALALTQEALDRSERTSTEKLISVMTQWVLFHTQRRDEAIIGATEIRSLEGEHRGAVITLRDKQEALFRSIIEEGVESGEFATKSPQQATWAIVTMGNTVANFFKPDGQLSPEEMADIYAALALATVRARTDVG